VLSSGLGRGDGFEIEINDVGRDDLAPRFSPLAKCASLNIARYRSRREFLSRARLIYGNLGTGDASNEKSDLRRNCVA